MGDLYEGRIGYHGNIQLKKSGGGGGVAGGRKGRGGGRKLNYVACNA